jgi:hypothetical protein
MGELAFFVWSVVLNGVVVCCVCCGVVMMVCGGSMQCWGIDRDGFVVVCNLIYARCF